MHIDPWPVNNRQILWFQVRKKPTLSQITCENPRYSSVIKPFSGIAIFPPITGNIISLSREIFARLNSLLLPERFPATVCLGKC